MEVAAEWTTALELDNKRKIIGGSPIALAQAIGRAADLRIYTEFRHNEHIDLKSTNGEIVKEVSEFAVTYLLKHSWSAGIMTLRQPVTLPLGFGPPSMSFFLYNQDGEQAIARPYLDGKSRTADLGDASRGMAKHHERSGFDVSTNAPSHNFVYDFESYRFCVSDSWREVLATDRNGAVISGSLSDLTAAFIRGCEMKVAVRDLCSDISATSPPMEHEIFVRLGPGYYYTEQHLYIAESHPLVRVRPTIPMQYGSRTWDFGWLLVRTDGQMLYRKCDPYTLDFQDTLYRRPVRWFVR